MLGQSPTASRTAATAASSSASWMLNRISPVRCRTASAAAEQAGRLAVTADLAGPVGEALQDVRETGCASTAAAPPTWGTGRQPSSGERGGQDASAEPRQVDQLGPSPAPWLGGLRRC